MERLEAETEGRVAPTQWGMLAAETGKRLEARDVWSHDRCNIITLAAAYEQPGNACSRFS